MFHPLPRSASSDAERVARPRRGPGLPCFILLALGALSSPGWAQTLEFGSGLEAPLTEDPHAAGLSFVEVVSDRATWFVGESATVRIRVGIEREFRASLLPLFRRELGLPLQVIAPWLPEGSAASPTDPSDPSRPSLALNEQVVVCSPIEDRSIDGDTYQVYETTHTLILDHPGPLALAGTTLRLAYATEFREQMFVPPVPKDPRVVAVPGDDLILDVAAPPEVGRPLHFTGAIGTFSIRAESDVQRVRVGESLELTLHVSGNGNLAAFPTPRLPDLDLFAQRGVTDITSGTLRTIRWELVARSGGAGQIPPIPLATFDPSPPARYHSLETRPISVEVLSIQGEQESVAPAPPRSIPARAPVAPKNPIHDRLPIVLSGLAIAAVGAILWRRKSPPGDSSETHWSPDALATFVERADQPGAELGHLMCEYLATNLGTSTAAVAGSDLAPDLAGAGIPAELAQRTADSFEAWTASRFGGALPAGGPEAARALVAELDRAFQGSKAAPPR